MQRLINIIKSVEKIEKLLGIQHKDDGDNYTYYTRYSLIVKSLCYYEIPYFYNILLNFKLSNFNVYGSINTVITHMGLPIAGPGLDFNLWLGALGGYYHWSAIPMIITSFLHWLPVYWVLACVRHEFHETCHSVTFIVLVNSHQR